MNELLTGNMIRLFLKKYDDDKDGFIKFHDLLKDLKMMEAIHAPALLIFEWKRDVENFIAEGGVTGFYEGQFDKRGRPADAKPEREPLFVCRSDKNTFYKERTFEDL